MLGTPTTPNESNRLRNLVAAAAVVAAATVTLVGAAGRGEASVATDCSEPAPSGRLFCVTVEDLDGVSPSGATTSGNQQVDVQAFGFYKLAIANSGGNTLTNGSVTLTLTDTITGQPAPLVSTAAFVPAGSAPFCSATSTSPNVVTCTLPNLAAGAATEPFYVAYRTSKTPGVVATTAAITTAFKEGPNQGANPADFTVFETTSLEPDPQLSVAWAPPGQAVRLGTSPADVQFSTLKFTVPGDKKAFFSSLAEGAGSICPEDVTCATELVTTNLAGAAAGTFSAQNPFVLTLTVSWDLLKKIDVVYHLKDGGVLEEIRTECSVSAPAVPDVLPCFKATRDNANKLLIVEIQAWENGRWQG
jgi:hypothetical protein